MPPRRNGVFPFATRLLLRMKFGHSGYPEIITRIALTGLGTAARVPVEWAPLGVRDPVSSCISAKRLPHEPLKGGTSYVLSGEPLVFLCPYLSHPAHNPGAPGRTRTCPSGLGDQCSIRLSYGGESPGNSAASSLTSSSRSLRSAFISICRARSRVTPNARPVSSSVWNSPRDSKP